MSNLPAEQRAEILEKRVARSERALRDAEAALEKRMRELFEANEELQVRESELARRLAIESSLLLSALDTVSMVTIYGERDRGFTISSGAAAMLGLPSGSQAELLHLIQSLHPLDKERILREGNAFFKDAEVGTAYTYEHRIKRFNTGETRWLSWSIKRERGNGDRPSYVLGSVRDITEERQNRRQVRALQLRAERRVTQLGKLQQEIIQANREVANALGRKTRFLTRMAHEIRTPLGGLVGGLELLTTKVPAEDPDMAVALASLADLEEIATSLIEESDTVEDIGEDFPTSVDEEGASSNVSSEEEEAPAKILLAEDTASNRYVIERMLEEMNCIVVSVDNGAAAVEAVRTGEFDAVLMDVMMPIMDGEEATQTIRNLEGGAARTPIIGITAHSLQDERERLLSAGMTACLAKPIRRDALATAIRTSLLAGRNARRLEPRFDHELFRRTFYDLPPAFRTRMRDAAKIDITRYASEVLEAIDAKDDGQLSSAAHSLTGVAMNVGAIGIVEELTKYRETPQPRTSPEAFRAEVAASLLAFDDLYDELIT
ncbi:response regulator [Erythrobacter litoralis]|uniref:response regulator n=1 Tax=Erythrobacter litoralis TaxID=39960 RepID=UPI002435F471|nr:response regulator [Erythrobacter litoralis]MDG6080292.1 response regulator [Erythrobacter litoralis]